VLPPVLDPALLLPMLDPPAAPPGCMAGDPDVVEPEPVAAGRSEEGAEVPCAKADAVTRAVAIRQAVIWVLSIYISLLTWNVDALAATETPNGPRGDTAGGAGWPNMGAAPTALPAYQQQLFAIVPGRCEHATARCGTGRERPPFP
jgi:hypothetical protein